MARVLTVPSSSGVFFVPALQGVEIFMAAGKSIMFAFSDRIECEQFVDTVRRLPGTAPAHGGVGTRHRSSR